MPAGTQLHVSSDLTSWRADEALCISILCIVHAMVEIESAHTVVANYNVTLCVCVCVCASFSQSAPSSLYQNPHPCRAWSTLYRAAHTMGCSVVSALHYMYS